MAKNRPQIPFLSAPSKYRSHHSCADLAEGAINLTADYFSAAPGTRQREDVRAGWEEGDVTADGLAWLVPGSWRKNSLPAWRSWGQKGDVGFLDMQCLATKALCVSACVSGTGIVAPCPLPGWGGWTFLEVQVTSVQLLGVPQLLGAEQR